MKGTIHWVSAAEAVDAEVRLFGPLLLPDTEAGDGGAEEEAASDDGQSPGADAADA